jgi:hypothetical protein
MTRTIKLTVKQFEVVERLLAEPTRRLIRIPGGWWTTPSTPKGRPGFSAWPDLPAWATTIQVVRALETRGLLARTHESREEWQDPRVLAHPDAVLLHDARKVEIPSLAPITPEGQ